MYPFDVTGDTTNEVIISADGDSVVYSVPDAVDEELSKYCIMFCDKWIKTSNDAAKYRVNGVYCYNKSDFIAWLNEFIFSGTEIRICEKSWLDKSRKESSGRI